MIPLILDAVLSVVAAVLLLPVLVLAIEVIAALWRPKTLQSEFEGAKTVAVLIPAHNEEAGISETLRSVVPQLKHQDRLLVVADNCSDATAAISAAARAEVISRTDLEKRGKGFALDFGIRHLRLNPPDILIVVDADCHVAPRAIDHLATLCANSRRPVQAQYLMRNKESARLTQRIAEFAWVVKNLMRPQGLAKLGLPCQLMGSGMAFPWVDIDNLDIANAHLVEDMKMGLDLARRGVPPLFCSEAIVLSAFPTDEHGTEDQRTRWEHGHLGIMLREAPSAILQGLKTADVSLLAMALDLCVPPLALLGMLTIAVLSIAAIFCASTGYIAPLAIMGCSTAVFGLAVIAAWVKHGRRIVSLADLISAPSYLLLKIPVYLRFVFSRQSEWVRSKRDKRR